ncbi:MAG: iron-containing alcohol dehydrogenase [SAR324 cluster bacterium]|nr:iron-containing alcohol dehydrogenase [SAR324 cluster bacterium]
MENQFEIRKFVSPEIIFGVDARLRAGTYLKNLGIQKALIVTDPGVIDAGWAGSVIRTIEEEGVAYSIYAKVSPNPRVNEVMEGSEFFKSEGCDGIVAVGGGSPIDCAKGIGIVSANQKNILAFEGVDMISLPIPPMICIPTTGGTSADVSQFAIITDLEQQVKIAIISKAVVPDVALIDPVTLTTMDAYLSACTSIDALVHAIEAFVSSGNSVLTDVHALSAIKILSENILLALQSPDDTALREKIMFGSLEAGLAFSNASLGGVHAMAHSLGGLLDLPHGECNAILLRHVMDFNYDVASERYVKIGQEMGMHLQGMTTGAKKKAILDHITFLRKEAGVEKTLQHKGVKIANIPELSKNAIKDPCLVTNPRQANQRDIEVIYEEAL